MARDTEPRDARYSGPNELKEPWSGLLSVIDDAAPTDSIELACGRWLLRPSVRPRLVLNKVFFAVTVSEVSNGRCLGLICNYGSR